MKSTIVAGMVAAGLSAGGMAGASEDLAKKSGCVMCHAVADKKAGPSFQDIAAKYKGKAGADAAIVAKLKAGKEHPPVKANEDDLKKLVKWNLAM